MTDAEKKLKRLQNCLGEKKLKQLGLIPCTTCREIMTKVMNISLPIDLQNKPFLTSEEMSTISQTIMESVNYSLNDPTSSVLSDKTKETHEDESSNQVTVTNLEKETTETPDSDSNNKIVTNNEDNYETVSEDEGQSYDEDESQITNEKIEEDDLITYDSANTEEELVSKLLAILNQSQHLTQGDLGIGYIYTPPAISPFSHTLNCTECGHMYTISPHPSLKLIPLPVYLTDTEYEMIKGIYVDIFL